MSPVRYRVDGPPRPTGRVKFAEKCWRFRSHVVVMVELVQRVQSLTARPPDPEKWRTATTWRELTPLDLSHPKLRWLVDHATQ